MDIETSALILAWVAICILAFALAGVMRAVRVAMQAQTSSRALETRIAAQDIADLLYDRGWKQDRDVIVLFMESACPSCEEVLHRLSSSYLPQLEEYRTFALYRGEPGDCAVPNSIEVATGQAAEFDRLGISMTPFGVAVGRDARVVAAELLGSAVRLAEFMERVRSNENGRSGDADARRHSTFRRANTGQ